jgi:nucleotide-binding universal stress UspA family protein
MSRRSWNGGAGKGRRSSRGRHGFDHLLLGSAAEGVVRTAPVRVLLIRKE